MIYLRLASLVCIVSLVAVLPLTSPVAGDGTAQDPVDLAPLGGEYRLSDSTQAARKRGTDDDEFIDLIIDDGSFEASLGIVNQNQTLGSQAYFLNRFTPIRDVLPLTIDEVYLLIPTSTSAGSTQVLQGSLFEVLVFTDPSGSGDPSNATLVSRKAFGAQPTNFAFHRIPLDDPVVVRAGDVWIGFTNTITRTDARPIFPAAIDTNSGSLGRSWAFFNAQASNHFDGPLSTAERQLVVDGNWLISATGVTGGLTRVCWSSPNSAARGDGLPPPFNTRLCSSVPPLEKDSFGNKQGDLLGFNVYRSNEPGVQPTPDNLFTSTPPTQTSANAGVNASGSFFVVTAVYEGGESSPSNETGFTPPTLNTMKVKPNLNKIVAKGTNFNDTVQVFVDGIPFVNPAAVKKNNTKVVQKGNLITGQTIAQYLAASGGQMRVTFRNANGALATRDFQQ